MSSAAEDLPKANRGRAAGPANRRALIAAAREVFAEHGLAAPLNAVARRAGVGQGSLYRHFPDRTALAAAVFEENLDDLERFAEPADRTLDDLLDRVVAQAMVSTAFIELTTTHRDDTRVMHLGERYRGVVERLLEREKSAGYVASHIEPEDVMLATGMLATELARCSPTQRTDVAARARALFRAAFVPR
ncbi:MAG: TetR/AcrR family transcriptional regulator [Microbacterium sp.]|uniref:helix-turn-helix domain-containing protein n=1 Tax=unclassified Microbacterium TaxID=2609290 RepID=UPI000DB3E6EB|nr:helix-turn-helix domain-containing protein [Microbacterium sp.]PZU37573.1 MAG: TetR/AcrR family transcriptional regulator [Microbacterium sp.]